MPKTASACLNDKLHSPCEQQQLHFGEIAAIPSLKTALAVTSGSLCHGEQFQLNTRMHALHCIFVLRLGACTRSPLS